jgi:hypothetical protein
MLAENDGVATAFIFADVLRLRFAMAALHLCA